MTYCVGLLVRQGIVLLSDTRTNAGLDNVSTYRKMFAFERPGERALVLMTAGSLSVTQLLVARLQEAAEDPEAESVLSAPTMLAAAELVGRELARARREIADTMNGAQGGPPPDQTAASLILAGQRRGGDGRMFLIYPEGNFIEATEDTPFLQIGEHKYGKPLLDRVIRRDTPIEDCVKAVLLSMDSTLRSNLSVGMPLDLAVIPEGECAISHRRRIEEGDASFARMSTAWSDALRRSFAEIAV
ncbi:MAG: peptidase [Hasllibacter sp.]